MADTKALSEVKALETFNETLKADQDRACYGINEVEKANDAQAIETLLITDSLFRCNDVKERKRYVSLVDSVRECGGDVKIFSSMHVSGERLSKMTGVAAILRFPLPDLDENDSDGDSDSDDDSKKNSDKSCERRKVDKEDKKRDSKK